MGSEGEEKEDAMERRRFQDKVHLRLGAIEQTNTRKRVGEKETRRKAPNKSIKENTEMKARMSENA